MQIPLLHQQILLQVEKLRDLHRSIMLHNSPVPAAELDNLLQEIRKLYGIALELGNENALQLLNEVQMASIKESPAPVTKEIHTENPPVKTEAESAPVAKKENSIRTSETVGISTTKQEEHHVEKRNIAADMQKMFQDTPTLANSFSEHRTLGDKIAAGDNKKRISDNLKTSVSDIKSAIGLNEKFQFINQLFQGDSKKYNTVVDQLNSSESEAVAMNVVKKVSEEFDWESHPASARMFIDIVERRFSA